MADIVILFKVGTNLSLDAIPSGFILAFQKLNKEPQFSFCRELNQIFDITEWFWISSLKLEKANSFSVAVMDTHVDHCGLAITIFSFVRFLYSRKTVFPFRRSLNGIVCIPPCFFAVFVKLFNERESQLLFTDATLTVAVGFAITGENEAAATCLYVCFRRFLIVMLETLV